MGKKSSWSARSKMRGLPNARPSGFLAKPLRPLPARRTPVPPSATRLRPFRPTRSSSWFVPDEEEAFVESLATEGAPQHSVEGVPVRYVVIPDGDS
jgi:hypothetical protein